VITVQPFSDEEQAIKWANGTPYGKDMSMYALEDYTQIKHVMASLS
jgi:acyl-CoA reductase-like NAD-dependent aldehyde dehydrogenase